MTADVASLTVLRQQKATTLATHPSRSALPTFDLPPVDRAAALVQIARRWEEIHTTLTTGPEALDDDAGHEVLQWLASALVHPTAVPSLVFTLPQLIAAVRTHDSVRDGDTAPHDVDCVSYDEALADAQAEIDAHLYPLLTGLPYRDACRRCRNTIGDVARWQTSRGCSRHGLVSK